MTDPILTIAAASLPATRWLIAAWAMLTAAQWLASARHFAPGGLLAWHDLSRLPGPRWSRAAQRHMPAGLARLLFVAQALLAVMLAVTDTHAVMLPTLAALISIQGVLVILSGHLWVDGSDKIALIAMVGALLAAMGVAAEDAGLALAGLLLAGGQLTVSYFVAGASKISVPGWRDGSWLTAILATSTWGEPRFPACLRTGGFAFVASWSVILLEALFPLALLAPAPILAAAMAAMMVFHILTAILMGLNKFPWAFAAAYPALWGLGAVIRPSLGLPA